MVAARTPHFVLRNTLAHMRALIQVLRRRDSRIRERRRQRGARCGKRLTVDGPRPDRDPGRVRRRSAAADDPTEPPTRAGRRMMALPALPAPWAIVRRRGRPGASLSTESRQYGAARDEAVFESTIGAPLNEIFPPASRQSRSAGTVAGTSRRAKVACRGFVSAGACAVSKVMGASVRPGGKRSRTTREGQPGSSGFACIPLRRVDRQHLGRQVGEAGAVTAG